jgi:hypothetical protein
MANRSDREPGHPAECPGRRSPRSRVGPSSRIPSGPAVNMNDCIDRPDTRLHPTNASEALFATCNAGAIHTGRLVESRRATVRRLNTVCIRVVGSVDRFDVSPPKDARPHANLSVSTWRVLPENGEAPADPAMARTPSAQMAPCHWSDGRKQAVVARLRRRGALKSSVCRRDA